MKKKNKSTKLVFRCSSCTLKFVFSHMQPKSNTAKQISQATIFSPCAFFLSPVVVVVFIALTDRKSEQIHRYTTPCIKAHRPFEHDTNQIDGLHLVVVVVVVCCLNERRW